MPRSIHCSFCKQQGHNIKYCNSNYKQYFKNVVLQYMAIDSRLNLDYKYTRYILSIYPLDSIRVLGFMCNVVQPDMMLLKNKTSDNLLLFHNQLIQLVTDIVDKLSIYCPHQVDEIIHNIEHNDMVQHSQLVHTYIAERGDYYMSLRQIHNVLFNDRKIIMDFSFHYNALIDSPDDCAICLNNLNSENSIRTNCHHLFCVDCLYTLFEIEKISYEKQPKCPLCRCEIYNLTTHVCQFETCVNKYRNLPALFPSISTKVRQDILFQYHSLIAPTAIEKKCISIFFMVMLIVTTYTVSQHLRTPVLSTV